MISSKDIPEKNKREIRQLCRFGCVICGCPLYQYDHIEGRSGPDPHRTDNLVLLCPNHHSMKTNELITKSEIRKFRDAAGRRPSTAWQDLFVEPRHLDIGSNKCFATDYFFIVTGRHWLGAKVLGGNALLQGRITDKNGRPLVQIIDGEISFLSENWDVEWTGKEITVKNAPGDILIRLRLDAESKRFELRGRPPLYDDSRLDIRDDGIFYRGNLLARNCTTINVRCGLLVVEKYSDPMPSAVGFFNRYKQEENFALAVGPDGAGFAWSNDFLKALP